VAVPEFSAELAWALAGAVHAMAVDAVTVMYVVDHRLYIDAAALGRLQRMTRPQIDGILEREYLTRIVGRPYTGPWPSPAAMRWLAGTDAAARPVPGVPAGAPTGVLPDTSAVSYTDDPAAFAAQVAAARACPDRGLSWRDGTTAPVLTGYGRGRLFAPELEYVSAPV